MAGKRFVIIGISDGESAWAGSSGEEPLRGRAVRAIRQTKVFSGGKRHHDLVAGLLPEGHRWIDIVVPLDKVFEDYERAFSEGNDIVVFASGDPLFYGFATTIKHACPRPR